MIGLTNEQVQARRKLAEIMRSRTDEPYRHGFTDGCGNFCSMGLAFETMRTENPELFYWYENKPGKKSPDIKNLNSYTSFVRGEDEMKRHFGFHDNEYHHLVDCNDDYRFSWDKMAEEILTEYDWEEEYEWEDE